MISIVWQGDHRYNVYRSGEDIGCITVSDNPFHNTHPFDAGNGDAETVLDQLYQAYSESHESDPPEISEGFKELECFLEALPLDDNNTVFNLCCRLCTAYEEKAFRHGLLYGAHLMIELDIS